ISLTLPTAALWGTEGSTHPLSENIVTATLFRKTSNGASSTFTGSSMELLPSSAPVSLAQLLSLFTLLWVLGAVAFLLVRFCSYGMFCSMLRKKRCPVTGSDLLAVRNAVFGNEFPLYRCNTLGSPSLVGFLHPAVYLPPTALTQDELFIVLQHEQCHAKRGDLYLKLLLTFAEAIYWWNPLVWCMARAAECDMECACDEILLRGRDLSFRKEYGAVLLRTLHTGNRRLSFVTGFSGNAKQLKHRICALLSTTHKAPATPALVLLCALLLLSGTLFACTGAPATAHSVPHSDSIFELGDSLSAPNDASSAVANAAFSTESDALTSLAFPMGDGYQGMTRAFDDTTKHPGIDLRAPSGTEILAAAGGVVTIAADESTGYGIHVVVDHGDGVTTLYGHCSTLLVSCDQHVEKGQVIAESGSSGSSTGPHLHFELRKDDVPLDPLPYFTEEDALYFRF
ncbi:MAG: M23/M56 family metallopeptidase, partial [Pygmaiobacter sp.]